MQKGLKLITLQGAIEKSPILLSQYCKNECLDGNIIISYFGGSNNIFADIWKQINIRFKQNYHVILFELVREHKRDYVQTFKRVYKKYSLA